MQPPLISPRLLLGRKKQKELGNSTDVALITFPFIDSLNAILWCRFLKSKTWPCCHKNLNQNPPRDSSANSKAFHQEYSVSDWMLLNPWGPFENLPAGFPKPRSSLETLAFLQSSSSNALKTLHTEQQVFLFLTKTVFSRKFVLSLPLSKRWIPHPGGAVPYPVCTHHCSPGAAGAWSAPAWPNTVPAAAGSSWTPLLSSPQWNSQPARWSSAPLLPESCKYTDKRFLESSHW